MPLVALVCCQHLSTGTHVLALAPICWAGTSNLTWQLSVSAYEQGPDGHGTVAALERVECICSHAHHTFLLATSHKSMILWSHFSLRGSHEMISSTSTSQLFCPPTALSPTPTRPHGGPVTPPPPGATTPGLLFRSYTAALHPLQSSACFADGCGVLCTCTCAHTKRTVLSGPQ